jgi:hypothetical protein
MTADLADIRKKLGKPGAAVRVAQIALKLAEATPVHF